MVLDLVEEPQTNLLYRQSRVEAQVREHLRRLDLHLLRPDLREDWVFQGLCDVHSLIWIEHEGPFQEVDPLRFGVVEQSGQLLFWTLWEGFYVGSGVLILDYV